MKKAFNSLVSWLLITLLATSGQLFAAGDDFTVVVSIKPIHSIVTGLMKDVGEPVLLIDGKQTPYDFEVSAKQKQLLADADIVIWVGKELESSLQDQVKKFTDDTTVLELLSNQRLKILPSRKDYNLRDSFFWLDDRNVLIMLDELTEVLIQKDPSRSHIYSRNRREMLKPLLQIDKEYEYGYRGLKAGIGVQYFDTLQYFEQAYALTTLGYIAATPRDGEDTARLLKMRNRISNKEAACLFVDKSMKAEHLDLLTEGQQINIGELDVLGQQFDAGPDLYLKLMEYNTDVIKQCLNADMDAAAVARLAAASDEAPAPDGIGGRFILTDHLGQAVTELDMKGTYSLIFFGYTSCPDICPTSLMVMAQALKKMGDISGKLRPYFISVDPERDTVKIMRDYVAYFDARLIGLTGKPQMIKRVADQFRVKYEKGKVDPVNPDMYIVDHTSSLYLMAPDGSFVTKFAHGISPSELVKQLEKIIN